MPNFEDEAARQEARRRAKLVAASKVDMRLELKRPYAKDKWGVSMAYSYRSTSALWPLSRAGPVWVCVIFGFFF